MLEFNDLQTTVVILDQLYAVHFHAVVNFWTEFYFFLSKSASTYCNILKWEAARQRHMAASMTSRSKLKNFIINSLDFWPKGIL